MGLISADQTSSVVALDPAGQVKPGWPYKTGDKYIWGIDLAPDGTVTVTSGGNNSNLTGHLAELGADGQPKPGWPTPLKSIPSYVKFASDGTVYFNGSITADSRIYAVANTGLPKPGWPVIADGSILWPPFELASDGTLYAGFGTVTATSIETRVYAFGPDGRPRPGWPLLGTNYSSPVLGPDGTIYLLAARSVIAYSPDGSLKLGWHSTVLSGDPFSMTVAPDGAVYVVASELGGGTQVISLTPTGSLVPGWHVYVTPKGGYATPVVIGPTGGVYVSLMVSNGNGGSSPGPTIALGPDGEPLGTWPPKLIDTNGSLTFARDGTAYVVNGMMITALAPDGTPKPGWPYRLSGTYLRALVTVGPDGTVYVVGASESGSVVEALTSGGTPVGSR